MLGVVQQDPSATRISFNTPFFGGWGGLDAPCMHGRWGTSMPSLPPTQIPLTPTKHTDYQLKHCLLHLSLSPQPLIRR